MKNLNVGIIGCGMIAFATHLKALDNHPNINLLAFHNRTISKAEKANERYGSKASLVYDNSDDLMNDSRLDAVFILTANDTHASYAIKALKAGKHVMVEKPMARNYKEALSMVNAALDNQKILSVAFQNRFRNEVTTLKNMIDQGKLGEIYTIKAKAIRRRGIPSWGNFTNQTIQGGGPLVDIGSHVLDLALYFIDFPNIKYVAGSSYQKIAHKPSKNTFGPYHHNAYDVEDSAFGFIKTVNEVTILLEASYALNTLDEGENIIEIYGSKAGALIDKTLSINYVSEDDFHQETLKTEDINPTQAMIDDFYDAIMNRQNPLVNAKEGLVVNRIIEAIYQASKENKPIYLKD